MLNILQQTTIVHELKANEAYFLTEIPGLSAGLPS
jgi:hypothetical protein